MGTPSGSAHPARLSNRREYVRTGIKAFDVRNYDKKKVKEESFDCLSFCSVVFEVGFPWAA